MKRVRRATSDDISDPCVVECRLCHKDYRAIGYTHLRHIHGFQGDHPIEDYKRRFGLDIAMCHDSRRLLRRGKEAYWERRGQRWTRKRVLDALRNRVRRGEPVAMARLDVPLRDAIARRYGKWTTAMRRARLDPKAYRLNLRWDEADVVAAISKRHKAGEVLHGARVEEEAPDLYRAGFGLFGNWGKALAAAGFDPVAHRVPKKWNLDHAAEWVRKAAKLGRSLIGIHVPSGLYGSVQPKVPGGWPAFVESLGIPYPGQRHRADWSAAAVLAEIRRRRRSGKPLNCFTVATESQAVTHQARKYFGSWDAALRAAGVDPLSVRKHRVWSRVDVLRGVLARHAAGHPMDHKSSRRDEPRLVKAAQTEFPSSWGKALAAAGLDRRLARGKNRPGPPTASRARRRPTR